MEFYPLILPKIEYYHSSMFLKESVVIEILSKIQKTDSNVKKGSSEQNGQKMCQSTLCQKSSDLSVTSFVEKV